MTAVLMLTVRDTLEGKITGLDVGADDYLVKPFEVQELETRIRALIRRSDGGVSTEILKVGGLTFGTSTLEVKRDDLILPLSQSRCSSDRSLQSLTITTLMFEKLWANSGNIGGCQR